MSKIKYKEINKNTIEYDTKITDFNDKKSTSKITVPFQWTKTRTDKKFKVVIKQID